MTDPTPLGEALAFVRPPGKVAEDVLNQGRHQTTSPLVAMAEQRAAALGLDLDAVLERDAERLTAFPTRECLTPSEVTALVAEEPLEESRRAHGASCEYCGAILVAARLTAEQRERFLDELAMHPPPCPVRCPSEVYSPTAERTTGATTTERPVRALAFRVTPQ